eukprot:gnl/Trimastix_PCT/4292.p1 GENE.gnl/Trimastix_PCT/4292~~gnl/Trimastix_PCT/4292.p1  ORF type:complete len:322 (-),score=12.48 gnl/Trimastix_PCT/4292:168-1133(-)
MQYPKGFFTPTQTIFVRVGLDVAREDLDALLQQVGPTVPRPVDICMNQNGSCFLNFDNDHDAAHFLKHLRLLTETVRWISTPTLKSALNENPGYPKARGPRDHDSPRTDGLDVIAHPRGKRSPTSEGEETGSDSSILATSSPQPHISASQNWHAPTAHPRPPLAKSQSHPSGTQEVLTAILEVMVSLSNIVAQTLGQIQSAAGPMVASPPVQPVTTDVYSMAQGQGQEDITQNLSHLMQRMQMQTTLPQSDAPQVPVGLAQSWNPQAWAAPPSQGSPSHWPHLSTQLSPRNGLASQSSLPQPTSHGHGPLGSAIFGLAHDP